MQQASDLRIETLANCRVRVSIRSGNSSSGFEFPSQQGSEIAARILNAARRSFAESGKPNPTTDETYWTAVPTSAVGLGPSEFADHESLLLQFGDTGLVVPLSKTELHEFGTGMWALSGDDTKGH